MVDTASFPKAPGRPGVRSAESIKDGLSPLCPDLEQMAWLFHEDKTHPPGFAVVPTVEVPAGGRSEPGCRAFGDALSAVRSCAVPTLKSKAGNRNARGRRQTPAQTRV